MLPSSVAGARCCRGTGEPSGQGGQRQDHRRRRSPIRRLRDRRRRGSATEAAPMRRRTCLSWPLALALPWPSPSPWRCPAPAWPSRPPPRCSGPPAGRRSAFASAPALGGGGGGGAGGRSADPQAGRLAAAAVPRRRRQRGGDRPLRPRQSGLARPGGARPAGRGGAGRAADDSPGRELFRRTAPRTAWTGYQRLADALARAGRAAEAAQVIRTGWQDAPADPAAESGFLERNAASLTPEEHWRRFDRLALAREAAAAGRVVGYLDPPPSGPRRGPPRLCRRPAGCGCPDAGRHRRRRCRADPASGPAGCAGATATRRPPPPGRRNADHPRRGDRPRRLAGTAAPGAPAAAARRCPRRLCGRRRHGLTIPGEPRQDAEFLAGFIALRRLEDAGRGASAISPALAEGSRSVITRARASTGRAGRWRPGARRPRPGPATPRRRSCRSPSTASWPRWRWARHGAALSARIARCPEPRPTARQSARLRGQGAGAGGAGAGRYRRDPARPALPAAAGGPGAGSGREGAGGAARQRRSAGPTMPSGWRAGPARPAAMLLADGWPTPYPAPRPRRRSRRWSMPSPGRRAISTPRRSPPPMPAG